MNESREDQNEMDHESWVQVEDLFHQVVALPKIERIAFLDRACATRPRLRRSVENLLAMDDGSSVALPSGLPQVLSRKLDANEMVGRRIGAYRLDRLIGTGGFGAVFLASRSDAAFEQQVAIKLLKRGMDTDAILSRFRNERQILAWLEHPNIARLLDGGATDEGLPYLVLEFVDGTPLREYCEAKPLGVRERLRLFLCACDAVQAAHQQLVVHRDLKPSNILVKDDGTLKLLDFGISKVLGDGLGDDSAATLTLPGERALTPQYASPEQLRGDPVTVASDVYALGVVLFELLTGQRPFQDAEKSVLELTRAVSERIAPLASHAAKNGNSAALRGDLDVLLATALAPEPKRRYGSVSALSADIRNYLGRLPLHARPASRTYRLKKFVSRNPMIVAALFLIGLLLAGWSVTARVQNSRLTVQRDKAGTEAVKAQQFSQFLKESLLAVTPQVARGQDSTLLRKLLADADLRAQTLEAFPIVRAEIHLTVGTVYNSIGDFAAAERNLTEALEILETVVPTPHKLIAQSADELMRIYRERGDLQQAAEMAMIAYENLLEVFAPDSQEALEAMNNIGLVKLSQNAFAEAEGAFREVIEDAAPALRSVVQNNLGLALKRQGKNAEASAAYREAIRLYDEVYGENYPEGAMARSNLALLLEELGDVDGARKYYEEALSTQRHIFPDAHPDLATTLDNYAFFLAERGECDRAVAYSAEALRMFTEIFGKTNIDVAFCLSTHANVLRQCDRLEEARTMGQNAVAMMEATAGATSIPFAIVTARYAWTLETMGDSAGARDALEQAFAIMVEELGPDHPRTAGLRQRLSALNDSLSGK